MPIVIKKRVSLEFLGDEYREAYLIFKSIPAIDFGDVVKELDTIKETENESLGFLIKLLQKYFLNGKFPNDDGELQDVTKEDIGQLDPVSITECFKVFTGQDVNDPKALEAMASPMPSPTTPTTSE